MLPGSPLGSGGSPDVPPSPAYGSGSGGALTWSAPATLAADTEATTIAVTAAINTGGYRIAATTSISGSTGGVISRDGNAASGTTGGAALAAGTLGGSGAGQDGGINGGTAGGSTTSSIGGAGRVGETGVGGAGGAGGTATAPTQARSLPPVVHGFIPTGTAITGGGGGGSAGGNGILSAGGGSGSGGGAIQISSPFSDLSGGVIVSARGGDGAAGEAGKTGGGGGGGGIIIIGDVIFGTLGLFDVGGGLSEDGAAVATDGTVTIVGTHDGAAPSAPTLSGNSPGAGQVSCAWVQNGKRAYRFEFQLDSDAGFPAPIIGFYNRATLAFTGSPGAGTWYARARAINSFGTSGWSNTVTIVAA